MAIQVVEVAKKKEPITVPTFLEILEKSKKGKHYQVHCIITPEVAQLILEKYNPANRRVSEASIKKYTRNMKNGGWTGHVGDEYTFDNKGLLNNGQHRLMSIVETNKSQEGCIYFGIDQKAKFSEGDGKPKSYFDMLTMTESSDAVYLHELASLVRLHYGFIRDQINPHTRAMNDKPSNIELNPIKQTYGDEILESIKFVAGIGIANVMTISTAAYTHYLFKNTSHGKAAADSFMIGLATGANLAPSDPCLTVRNRFLSRAGVAIKNPATGNRDKTVNWTSQRAKEIAIGLMQKAFNARVEGKTWNNKEHNPESMIIVNGLTKIGKIPLYVNSPVQGKILTQD